jgi:histidinol-phosphatase
VTSLADAQILYGSARDLEASGRAPGFRGILADAWRERGFGDFWGYALVAEGAAEAMIEVDLSAWDAAAPFLIVEEAGGRATDFAGRRVVDSRTFIATNGAMHDLIRERLLAG